MQNTRQTIAFLLLVSLLGSACGPARARGNNNGGGGNNNDEAVSNDDDAVSDDDDSVGTGTEYTGSADGYLKSPEVGGDCSGEARITVDADGYVTSGTLTCGNACEITFVGPYAWSEESFSPNFDCAIDGYSPEIYEVDAWIWGGEGEYVGGSLSSYGGGDYFSLSFEAYLP